MPGIVTDRNDLLTPATPPAEAVEWQISRDLVPYQTALAEMDTRVAGIANGTSRRQKRIHGPS